MAAGKKKRPVKVNQVDNYKNNGVAVLSDQDRFNRQLFEALPIGLAICHMDGRLTYVNAAYASITGHSVEEALTLIYWQVSPIGDEKFKVLRRFKWI